MLEEFPHKHGPEIMHEHPWDECKREIASTQDDLLKTSELCAISCQIDAFNGQFAVYNSDVTAATSQSATNDSNIGALMITN